MSRLPACLAPMQGITYDKHRRVLYTAMSAVRYGMEDNQAKGKAEEK